MTRTTRNSSGQGDPLAPPLPLPDNPMYQELVDILSDQLFPVAGRRDHTIEDGEDQDDDDEDDDYDDDDDDDEDEEEQETDTVDDATGAQAVDDATGAQAVDDHTETQAVAGAANDHIDDERETTHPNASASVTRDDFVAAGYAAAQAAVDSNTRVNASQRAAVIAAGRAAAQAAAALLIDTDETAPVETPAAPATGSGIAQAATTQAQTALTYAAPAQTLQPQAAPAGTATAQSGPSQTAPVNPTTTTTTIPAAAAAAASNLTPAPPGALGPGASFRRNERRPMDVLAAAGPADQTSWIPYLDGPATFDWDDPVHIRQLNRWRTQVRRRQNRAWGRIAHLRDEAVIQNVNRGQREAAARRAAGGRGAKSGKGASKGTATKSSNSSKVTKKGPKTSVGTRRYKSKAIVSEDTDDEDGEEKEEDDDEEDDGEAGCGVAPKGFPKDDDSDDGDGEFVPESHTGKGKGRTTRFTRGRGVTAA